MSLTLWIVAVCMVVLWIGFLWELVRVLRWWLRLRAWRRRAKHAEELRRYAVRTNVIVVTGHQERT